MLLRNFSNMNEYDVEGPVYENLNTNVWCGTCIIDNSIKAFVKILNYGEISNNKKRKELLNISIQEVNTLRKIRNCSKRVPSIIDAWDDEKHKRYIIIMTKIPGASLRDWIKKHRKDKLDAKDVFVRVKIIQQLCEIMRDLVVKNPWLVHRDLKPENICINLNERKKWEAYILDFGSANLNYLRREGTVNYQAPEQIDKYGLGVGINCSVDMFAIGQIFYELLIGKAPIIDVDYTYRAKENEWRSVPKLPDYLLNIDGVTIIYETIIMMTKFNPYERLTFGKAINILNNVRIG